MRIFGLGTDIVNIQRITKVIKKIIKVLKKEFLLQKK